MIFFFFFLGGGGEGGGAASISSSLLLDPIEFCVYFSMDLQITTTTLIDIVNFICIWMGINWPQSGE